MAVGLVIVVVLASDRLTGLGFELVDKLDQPRRRRGAGDLVESGSQQPADGVQPLGVARLAPLGGITHERRFGARRLNLA
jgi:hypothetical protein